MCLCVRVCIHMYSRQEYNMNILFYETIVERNNCFLGRTVEQKKKDVFRHCITILEMIGIRVKSAYEDSAPHNWGSLRLGISSNAK